MFAGFSTSTKQSTRSFGAVFHTLWKQQPWWVLQACHLQSHSHGLWSFPSSIMKFQHKNSELKCHDFNLLLVPYIKDGRVMSFKLKQNRALNYYLTQRANNKKKAKVTATKECAEQQISVTMYQRKFIYPLLATTHSCYLVLAHEYKGVPHHQIFFMHTLGQIPNTHVGTRVNVAQVWRLTPGAMINMLHG